MQSENINTMKAICNLQFIKLFSFESPNDDTEEKDEKKNLCTQPLSDPNFCSIRWELIHLNLFDLYFKLK